MSQFLVLIGRHNSCWIQSNWSRKHKEVCQMFDLLLPLWLRCCYIFQMFLILICMYCLLLISHIFIIMILWFLSHYNILTMTMEPRRRRLVWYSFCLLLVPPPTVCTLRLIMIMIIKMMMIIIKMMMMNIFTRSNLLIDMIKTSAESLIIVAAEAQSINAL